MKNEKEMTQEEKWNEAGRIVAENMRKARESGDPDSWYTGSGDADDDSVENALYRQSRSRYGRWRY